MDGYNIHRCLRIFDKVSVVSRVSFRPTVPQTLMSQPFPFVPSIVVLCQTQSCIRLQVQSYAMMGSLGEPRSLIQMTQHQPNLIASFGLILFFITSVWAPTHSCIKASTSNNWYFFLPESCLARLRLFGTPFSPNVGPCFALQENEFSSKIKNTKLENQILVTYLFNDRTHLPTWV